MSNTYEKFNQDIFSKNVKIEVLQNKNTQFSCRTQNAPQLKTNTHKFQFSKKILKNAKTEV